MIQIKSLYLKFKNDFRQAKEEEEELEDEEMNILDNLDANTADFSVKAASKNNKKKDFCSR